MKNGKVDIWPKCPHMRTQAHKGYGLPGVLAEREGDVGRGKAHSFARRTAACSSRRGRVRVFNFLYFLVVLVVVVVVVVVVVGVVVLVVVVCVIVCVCLCLCLCLCVCFCLHLCLPVCPGGALKGEGEG